MAIRVAPGAADLACDLAGQFLVQVSGASDEDAATIALQRARDDVIALSLAGPGGHGPVVSNAVLAPSGPLLRVAELQTDEELIETVPDLVARRLEEAGLADGLVEVLEPGGPLDRLDRTPSAVVLRLFPAPEGEAGILPAPWIDLACELVLGDLAAQEPVRVRLLGAPYTVASADAPATFHQAALARVWCDLVQGDLDDRIRTASLTFGRTPHLALAAGGPGCDAEALLARFDLLCDLARDLSDGVAYCCVDFETAFDGIGLGLPTSGWRNHGGASPNLVAGLLGDVCVPDAFPFQILGPGHVDRLMRLGDRGTVGTLLRDGRTEVSVGEPLDWLPMYDTRDDELERGWKELSPLLVTEEEATQLLSTRPETGRHAEVPPAPVTGPDLATIVLEALPHPRRGLHLTFLELASWLAHEPHSDIPRAVSPVLAAYARWLASALDDHQRRELVSRAPLVIGTRSPMTTKEDWRTLPPDDGRRVWAAADWLLRVQAPAWLRAADLGPAARRIAAVRAKADNSHISRAVELAGEALDELTAAAARARAEVPMAEELAWQAWERAAETSGWVAASEAGIVGIPALLADAVELRVIELTRADEVWVVDVVDAARAAALSAVASSAWDAGWAAARAAIDVDTVVPYDTAFERSRSAAARRLSLDRDSLEAAIDAAGATAREALAAGVLGGYDPATAWDAAMRSATGSATGGVAWDLVQHMMVGVVDSGPWEAGMDAATTASARVLHAAPSLIERTVAVAIAREAAGAAAREAARRAASEALASGLRIDDAAAIAHEALAPTTAVLSQAAVALLDALIAAG